MMKTRRDTHLHKIGRIAAAASLLLLESGCGSSGLSKVEPVMASAPPEAAPSSAAASVDATRFRFPLTGRPSDTEVTARPIGVMVENAPQARPQSGLDKADLVYEVLAEGEITRFFAVYQSQTDPAVGPVRSIRPYFVELGEGLDAVLVHAGWSQAAMNIMSRDQLSHFDEVYGDGAYYWRSPDRKMPHNLYTSLAKIRTGMQKKSMRQSEPAEIGWSYGNAGPGDDGRRLNEVVIPYLRGYQVSYTYDPASGRFLRSMDGKPHLDKETGQQLGTNNVLIAEAKHQVVDSAGRRDVDVFGPGRGYLLQMGVVREVTWERKGGMIRAYSGDRELPMMPGNTWVQIVPEGTQPEWK